MRAIRKKLFILSYLGSLLLIVATFVPITKFNNQSFAFIDQFFYLSFAIIILSAINIILVTGKKYKISLIPTVLNTIIIAYGIYDILTIEGLKMTPNFTYGIALILYPIGIVFNLIGGLFTIGKGDKQKEITPITYDKKVDDNLEVSEPSNIVEDSDISLNYEEQIPISNLLDKNNLNKEQDNLIENNIVGYTIIEDNNIPIKDINDDIKNVETENIDVKNTSENLDNVDNEMNVIEENQKQVDTNDNIPTKGIEIDDNKISILDENDELLEEIEDYEYKDDDDFFEEVIDDIPINDHNNIIDEGSKEEIFMDDITQTQKIVPVIEENQQIDNEIPDVSISDENIMTNNMQVEDKPKPEFMALNPSDIKIDEKKVLFKKKEKKEEDPLARLMKRNIPMTLGRTCQFCGTKLGDDERICPICGRIN